MPRSRRICSNSGYYHIMLRGNERKYVFHDDEDRYRFLEILYSKKKDSNYHLQAFCLMNNHVHLMLRKDKEEIADLMKRVNVSYVHYFNKKYNRVGHLYQDRFKSEIVEDDPYALCLARYIHQNPIKAGIVENLRDYNWSSYNCYLTDNNEWNKLIEKDTLFNFFSEDRGTALKEFVKFMNEKEDESFIDIKEDLSDKIDEKTALKIYNNLKNKYAINSDSTENLIKEFKNNTNLSIRKISSITGLNRNMIDRILKK